MYFCNVYAWILIKYQLHFDFLVVFTLLVRPCQLLYHVSWLLYYWSLHFFFFVLTSGRPLPGTTFFVLKFEATLQPLCSADRDSGIFCTAATALFIAVKGLSTAARNSQNLLLLQPALLQLFCSASWSHSAALQQRYSFRTGTFFRDATYKAFYKKRSHLLRLLHHDHFTDMHHRSPYHGPKLTF